MVKALTIAKALDAIFIRENGVETMSHNVKTNTFEITLGDGIAPVRIVAEETANEISLEIRFSSEKFSKMTFTKTKVRTFEMQEIAGIVLSLAKNNALKKYSSVKS